jgi:ABC-type antimicrobial peptide transport system permease subunit
VEHVSSGFSVPWRDEQGLSIGFSFAATGARRADGQDYRAKFRSVSPNFFATFGVPILEGRDFNDGDKDGSERVVIISQSLAQMLYPGQDAVNRTMRWTDGVMKFIGISYEPRRIIAVVPDFDDENIIPQPAMTIYQPVDQEWSSGRLFVRAHQDAYALVPAITQVIHQMSADQPVEKASTLGDVRAEVLTPDKLNAVVFGGFAAVALLISVVGVAGVLAFSVSGRTREFGIRMALGAQPRNILTDVLTEGVVMAGIGVGAGGVVGFILARIVSKYVTALDQPGAAAFIASAGVILGAAVIASAVPAARAARVNAVEALRSE